MSKKRVVLKYVQLLENTSLWNTQILCIHLLQLPQHHVESKITGEVEAHVIAMACHNPPEGYCRWTLRLLSERMLQMNYVVDTEI